MEEIAKSLCASILDIRMMSESELMSVIEAHFEMIKKLILTEGYPTYEMEMKRLKLVGKKTEKQSELIPIKSRIADMKTAYRKGEKTDSEVLNRLIRKSKLISQEMSELNLQISRLNIEIKAANVTVNSDDPKSSEQ